MGVTIMGNTKNRDDAETVFRSFFIGLDKAYQQGIIQKMQKKPPDPSKNSHDYQCEAWEKDKEVHLDEGK